MIDEDAPASDEPVIDDVAEPKEIAKRAERRLSEDERRVAFWRRVMADPIGRSEIWRLLIELHAFDTRFACGPNGFPQPEATWFEAGRQDFGLTLYQRMLAMDRLAVCQMHEEHDPAWPKTGPRRRPRASEA